MAAALNLQARPEWRQVPASSHRYGVDGVQPPGGRNSLTTSPTPTGSNQLHVSVMTGVPVVSSSTVKTSGQDSRANCPQKYSPRISSLLFSRMVTGWPGSSGLGELSGSSGVPTAVWGSTSSREKRGDGETTKRFRASIASPDGGPLPSVRQMCSVDSSWIR